MSRLRRAVLAGHRGEEGDARALLGDPDPGVRAAALAALGRIGAVAPADLSAALDDPDPGVRRRACEVAVAVPEVDLRRGLADPEPSVIEAAAWALGERGPNADPGLRDPNADPGLRDPNADPGLRDPNADPGLRGPNADVVADLARIAVEHDDPLCREAAVAALGAIGDPAGLPAILAATHDRPAVRRRAVICLAPFEGPEVEGALHRALGDRDWQVRQAAEDLLGVRP